MERFIEVRPKLTKAEYNLLKHIPNTRRYTELAKATGLSVAYTSTRIKRLQREKIKIKGIFDLNAMKLSPIFIVARYSQYIYNHPREIKIPYILKMDRIFSGKKEKLIIVAATPFGAEEEFIDALNISVESYYSLSCTYRWRPDSSKLTNFKDGILLADFENMPKKLPEIETHQPSAPMSRVPDMIDIWLIAEMMRNPYTKFSTTVSEAGVKQQVASYHLLRHVLPYYLYNAVDFRHPPKTKTVYLKIYVKANNARKIAKALAETPACTETYVPTDDNIVIAPATMYPAEEAALMEKIMEIDAIEDYEVLGTSIAPPREYTIPFKKVVGYGTWLLDPVYAAVKAILKGYRRVRYPYRVYELP